MPITDFTSATSFNQSAVTKYGVATGAQGMGGQGRGMLSTQIDETNRRLDGVLRHQTATPAQQQKLEQLRKAFNDRMNSVQSQTTDRAKAMQEYRDARKQLSDGLTELFGGPRAG